MHDPSIEDVAERFDAVYTRLTALQRRLIAATRNGLDDHATRELARDAAAVVAAVSAAERAGKLAAVPARQVEAEALRARVLVEPVAGILVMAAARSQSRAYAYPLLAEVIELGSAFDAWASWTVLDVLVAPQSIGEATGRRIAQHASLPIQATLGDLDSETRARLVAGLREWAVGLPAEVSGRSVKAKPRADGVSAGSDVLARWVAPIGQASDPVRLAAREASLRDGWPADAVPVAEALFNFTHTKVMPTLVPDFVRIVEAEPTDDGLIAALRAEGHSYREAWRSRSDAEDAEAQAALIFGWVIERHILALQAVRKAREQIGRSRQDWRGPAPLAHARTVARRCGEVLRVLPEDAIDLLTNLPSEA